MVFTGPGWTCTACGKCFKSRRAADAGDCAGMLPAALLAHPTHQLHYASFSDCNLELPLALCTRCGAHGTSKVANLAVPCPAAAGACSRSAPFRRQAAAVKKGMHPSRRGVPLHDLRAVPPGLRAIAWTARWERELRADASAATAAEPTPAADAAAPHPGVPAPAAAALAAPGGDEAGTGLPMEELLALEALAAEAHGSDTAPASDDELGFGGFDDD